MDFSDSYFTDLDFSWTDKDGFILPVRHQQETHGCYAFCLVDLLYSVQCIESAYEPNPSNKGSEQELIDCLHLVNPNKAEVNHEGVGSSLVAAIAFIKRYGLSLEKNSPFLGICRQLPNLDAARQPRRWRIFLNDINNLMHHEPTSGYVSTPSDIENDAAKIIARPIILGIIAYPSCMDLGVGRGVYAGPTQEERDAVAQDASQGNDPRYGYHTMFVVGFGRRNGNIHYLAKNSYGDEWGFHGFIKLEANIRPPFYEEVAWMNHLEASNDGSIKTVFNKVAPFPK